MAEGEFARRGGRAQAAGGPVAQQDDPGVEGFGLLDPVAEEVVGVGPGGEGPCQQGTVGGERLGKFGREGRAAGEFGQDRGEPAPDRARGVALRPDEGQGVREFGGEGLGRVAVRGDGRPAALRRTVQAVGDALQCLRGRGDQADAVEEREQRGDQGPEGAGAGCRGLGVVLAVRGGGHRDDEAVHPVDRFAQRRLPGRHGHDRATAAVRLLGEEGETRFGPVRRGDEEQVDGAGPAGQRPAHRARGGGDAGRVDARDRGEGSGQSRDQVGDAGRGGTGACDEDAARAALRVQLADPGLHRLACGGTDPGPGLGGAAEQAAAVGSGQGLRGVEQRLVEHGDGPPITCRSPCGVGPGLRGAACLVDEKDGDAVPYGVGQATVRAGADQFGAFGRRPVVEVGVAGRAGQDLQEAGFERHGVGPFGRSGGRARSGWCVCVFRLCC